MGGNEEYKKTVITPKQAPDFELRHSKHNDSVCVCVCVCVCRCTNILSELWPRIQNVVSIYNW
jgi:hypothetical protein